MEEDLNDIDIIDKYLSGELNEAEQQQFKNRCLTDNDFKNEVEIYRKIYEGLEQASEADLKDKLSALLDEYEQEDVLTGNNHDNVRPINWRKTIYMLSGIAASVCLFAVVYWYYQQSNIKGSQYAGSKRPAKDSPQIARVNGGHKIHVQLPTDSGGKNQINPYINSTTAFTSEMRLSANAIRQANYPQPLSYTFNDETLTLYGDPLLGMMKLSVIKKDTQYYLVYDDAVYQLNNTSIISPLIKQNIRINNTGHAIDLKVTVQIAPQQCTVYTTAPFGVLIAPDRAGNKYYFTKQNDKNMLVLQGNFNAENCILVNLTKDGLTNWYVVAGSHVFIVGKFTDKPAPLTELSGVESAEARMFIKRPPVQVTVLSP